MTWTSLDTDGIIFGLRLCPACGRKLPVNSEHRECRKRRARERVKGG